MSSKKRKFGEIEEEKEIEESKLEKVDLGKGYIYVGELKDDKINGKGILTSPTGSVYEGHWKDNKRHGRGKQTYKKNDKNEDVFYEGQWKDNKRHGKGIMKHDDGYIYDGEWKDDKMHGKGKMTSPNGTVYDGKWIDDKKQGKGIMTYSNGDVFVGEWKDDKKHIGEMTFKDGDIYKGEFIDNMFHGNGKYSKKIIDSEKYIYYEGKWINSKKQGKGKETFPNGTVFEGEWQNNHKVNKGKITYFNGDIYEGYISPDYKKNGKGRFTSQSGFIYDGEWKDDKKNGKGKMTIISSGNIYDGDWKDDKFHGKGILTKSSYVYDGEFENGKKNGKGKKVYENGDVYDGEWTNDKMHGKGKYTKVNGNFYEGEFNDDKKYTYGSFYSSSTRKLSKGLIERNKTTNDAKIKYGISKEGETTSYIINGQEILEIETLPKYIKESIKKTCEEATKFNYISIKNEDKIKKLYEERKTSAENSIHFKVEGDSLNNIYLEKVHTSILNKYPYFTTRLKEGNFKDEPIGVEIVIEDKKTLITEEKKIIISKIIEDFIKILYFEETERNEETACELERLIDKYLFQKVKLLGEIEDGRRSRKKRKSIRKSKNKKSIKKGIKRKSKNKKSIKKGIKRKSKIKKSIKKRY
jgi:hypothetical protein